MVFGSSFHVYGAPLAGCVDETHPLGSFSDLSHLSKIYVEKLLEMYTRSSDISGVSVRLGIVYGLGPVMKSDPLFITVPNLFARRAAQGQPLRVNPTATAAMAFLHVEDAVSALLAACELQSRYADANAVSEALSVSQVALAVRDAASDRGLNVHIEPEPRPGLFCYLLDERRVFEGGAVSDGGNLYAWLERTLRLDGGELGPPDGHGLTFLPLLGGERSPGWNSRARGAIAGLTFDAGPGDLLQAAFEGIAYRIAESAQALPEVREVVATGHGLLENTGWIQIFADVLGRPVTASDVAEGSARGAAAHVLERLGVTAEPAPLGRTYEPDAERHEVYAAARERQRELYERLF